MSTCNLLSSKLRQLYVSHYVFHSKFEIINFALILVQNPPENSRKLRAKLEAFTFLLLTNFNGSTSDVASGSKTLVRVVVVAAPWTFHSNVALMVGDRFICTANFIDWRL